MSIITQTNQQGLLGPVGNWGAVASGILPDISLKFWGLANSGRTLLDDICCDNYITTSGIDPSSQINYNSNFYCERLYTSSGVFYTLPLSVSANYSVTMVNSLNTLSVSGGPTARESTTLVYSNDYNLLYLFGGNDGSPKNDLWAYNPTTLSWSQPTVLGASPPARYNHSMIYNTSSGIIVVFGGQVASGVVNDTWAYAIASGTWTQMTPSGTFPSVRAEHSAIYDPVYNQMIVWGGHNASLYFNETSQLSFANNYWNIIYNATTPPVARSKHAAAYDGPTQQMVLIGGSNATTIYNELWVYNIENNYWVNMQSITDGSAKLGQSLAIDPIAKLGLAVGGQYSTGLIPSDIILFDWSLNYEYNYITGSGYMMNPATAWNLQDHKMYIFGGRDSSGNLTNALRTFERFRHVFNSGLQVTTTTDSNHFLTAGWTHLDSLVPSQKCSGYSRIFYAFSFNQRNTWSIYTLSSGWSQIARNNGGTWQYNTASGTWQNATINTGSGALTQAMSLSNNQWYYDNSDMVRQSINCLPTMLSNTSPAPYSTSASTIWTVGYDAWMGFGGASMYWEAGSVAGAWLQINTGIAFVPYQYRWMSSAGTGNAPKRFKLQGYNSDTGLWDDLDTTYAAADLPQVATDVYSSWFPVNATRAYKNFRLYVISGYSGTYLVIKRLEIAKIKISPLTMTRSHWEASGGFVPGTTKAIDVAVGIQAIDALPSVNGITATYMTSDANMTLLSQPWTASAVNPKTGQVIIKCKLLDSIILNTDLTVWVSMDGGNNYDQITNLSTITGYSGFTYIVGENRSLTPRNNNIMKTKVVVGNYKNVLFYGMSLGVDY